MGKSRLLAVLAAAAIPFFYTAWIGLVSVDQPNAVDRGQSFTATIDAVGYLGGYPIPLDGSEAETLSPMIQPPPTDDPPAGSDSVTLRLGVLVPEGWQVPGMKWAAADGTGTLEPAPDEAPLYEAYYPAPAGYSWRTFRGDDHRVSDGAPFTFSVGLKAGSNDGLYTLVYMTWAQPPYRAVPVAPDAPDQLPYPSPSILETTIAVGEVGPAPRVVAWDPPDGSADVPRDADVRVTFDRDMDVDSLRNGGVQLYAGPLSYIQGRPEWQAASDLAPDFIAPPWEPRPVAVQIFYNAATKTAVIDPLEPLRGHTAHTVLVTYAAKATDGVPVDVARAASFLTERGPEPPFFSDVPGDHRFRLAIETLYRQGIVHGYPDNTFRPEAVVTRAQLATWLVLLLGIHTVEPGPPPPFADAPADADSGAWDYIGEAARAGVAEGFADGTFRPHDTVTRIQLTRMIVRASQSWLAPPPPGFSADFADVDVSDLSFVDWASYNDLVDGKAPGRFDPWSTATRGHAARILYGVWQRMNGAVPVYDRGASGIEGLVTLGPLHPVERPGETNRRPYAATIVIATEDGSKEVARAQSGADGRFRVAVDPGVYLVRPVRGGEPYPTAAAQTVKVEAGTFTSITVEYDTGIR